MAHSTSNSTSNSTATGTGEIELKKSIVFAFCKLLQALKRGDEVLLLTSSDPAALGAIQEYNDLLHAVIEEKYGESTYKPVEKYRQFVDHLAAVFDAASECVSPDIPKMRKRDELQDAAMVIGGLLKSSYVAGLNLSGDS